jgi:hypothetical protein
MSAMSVPDPIPLAGAIRLPSFAGSSKSVADPIVEPLWSGIRVIVAAGPDGAAMFDAGQPLTTHGDLLEVFAETAAATCDGVIVEAWLTRQVAVGDVGVFTGTDGDLPSTGAFIGQVLLGSRSSRLRQKTEELEAVQAARILPAEEPVDLVVVDLLWLDGQWLLDVPLQERKRILESVVPAGDLVRPGIHVRPPIDSWVGSWRAQGFAGLTLRAANSRYRPGEAATDWATTPMPRR